MLKSIKKLLDWQWLAIALLIVNLGIIGLISQRMSQTNEELVKVQKERDELILINKTLYDTVNEVDKMTQSQKLLINRQSELLFKQYNIIKALQNHLQWLKDNVLPQPPGPEFDPDKWT